METVSARLPEDLADQLEEYRNAHAISESEAIRRLLADGLENDELRDRVDDLERRLYRLERRADRRPLWWPW